MWREQGKGLLNRVYLWISERHATFAKSVSDAFGQKHAAERPKEGSFVGLWLMPKCSFLHGSGRRSCGCVVALLQAPTLHLSWCPLPCPPQQTFPTGHVHVPSCSIQQLDCSEDQLRRADTDQCITRGKACGHEKPFTQRLRRCPPFAQLRVHTNLPHL